MNCTNCGSEINQQWNFCPDCGKRRAVFEEPITDEGVSFIFGKMFKERKAAQNAGAYGYSNYGSGVRQQVCEVIVRQAMAGAPWRQICAGPMQVNNITEKEILEEVERRQQQIDSDSSGRQDEKRKSKTDSKKTQGSTKPGSKNSDLNNIAPPRPSSTADWRAYSQKDSTSLKLDNLRERLSKIIHDLLQDGEADGTLDSLLRELEAAIREVAKLESIIETIQREIDSRQSFDREQDRTSKPFLPNQNEDNPPDDPHRIDW